MPDEERCSSAQSDPYEAELRIMLEEEGLEHAIPRLLPLLSAVGSKDHRWIPPCSRVGFFALLLLAEQDKWPDGQLVEDYIGCCIRARNLASQHALSAARRLGLSDADGEDAEQEVLIKACSAHDEAQKTREGAQYFERWIRFCIANKLKDMGRKEGVKIRTQPLLIPQEEDNLTARNGNLALTLEHKDLLERILSGPNGLKQRDRLLLEKVIQHGGPDLPDDVLNQFGLTRTQWNNIWHNSILVTLRRAQHRLGLEDTKLS